MSFQLFLLLLVNSEMSVNKKMHSPIAIPPTGENTVRKFMEAFEIPKKSGWKYAKTGIIVLITAIAIGMDSTFSITI
jgi:hypothetical protein